MATYNPGFGTGKTFKTVKDLDVAALNGWITPEYIQAMATARPDLFEGIDDPSKLVTKNYWEGESGPVQQGYALDPKLQKLLSGMSMNRVGAEGKKDGRSNALVDAQGNLIFADKPYTYDPAGDTLKSALEAAALAAAAFGGIGMLGHGPLAGMLGGGGGAGSAATAAGEAAGGLGALEAGAAGAGELASLGGLDAVAAAEAASGGLGSLGAAGGAGAASNLNPALIESALGTSGYGASSAGLGGVTAGQSAAAAALNPYLNAIGKLSPELASTIASGTGGITSGLGSIADAILPSSVLSNVGGTDGISGGLLGGLLGGGKGGSSDWLKMLLPAIAGYASYKDAKKPQLTGYSGGIKPATATRTTEQGKYGPISRTGFAAGGEVGQPRYLNSPQDGMQDGIAAHIDGKQAAALSGGEFVIPADVVSHLGNGNSNAGAKQLYSMMERIRAERTGNPQQGKQIQPQRFLPR